MIGIQNSSNKSKSKFNNDETIDLPVSFIVGVSFIQWFNYREFFSLKLIEK